MDIKTFLTRPLTRSPRRMAIVAACVFLVGLAATAVAYTIANRMIAADVERRFTSDAVETTAAISERLRAHAEVLVSMQGLYASVGNVDRAQFRRYVDVLDLARRYPGFDALQVLRHVNAAGRDAFVARVRADTTLDPRGQPNFSIHPQGERPDYNVVEFVEPQRGNEAALGLDAGASPVQLDSLRRAAATGRIVATPPVRLVQDVSGGMGFIIRAPIYHIGEPVQTMADRHAALYGFAAAVYRINDLMRGVLDARTLQQMHIRLVDRGYAKTAADGVVSNEPEDPSAAATLMYDSQQANLRLVTPVAPSAQGIATERAIVVGERIWLLQYAARPGSIYEADPSVPNLVLGSGGIISLLISLLSLIALRSRLLSGNLDALDAEQRALVENPLAGILFTDGCRVLRGNRRIAELCGLSPEDLTGLDLTSLVVTPDDAAAVREAVAKIHNSGAAGAELNMRRSDGVSVPVDIYGRPLLPMSRGARSEILWVIQDRTDALLVEAERRDHARELQNANERLTASLHAAEDRTREIELLTELSGVLQSCHTLDEIFASVQSYAGRLFPTEAGALYVLNEDRNLVDLGAQWGNLKSDSASFHPDACWGLRRGRTFPVSEASRDLSCTHAAASEGTSGAGCICQPLIAQNNLLGLLYRELGDTADGSAAQLATMLAEQVSLAIANIELREQLRDQALRDPLTGLHNRRYLEEALAREIALSERSGKPLALAILDLDQFKNINDTHSHEAGDAVLRGVGEILHRAIRKGDVVGRFGGEEFMLLMPGAELGAATQLLNDVQTAVRNMHVTWPGGALDGVTASIGLAVLPLHVALGEDLMGAADAALYQAKRLGRDRVEVSDIVSAPFLVPGKETDRKLGQLLKRV